jgi:hypothetical protein
MLMKDYPRDIQEFVRERSKLLYNPKYGIDAQFLFTAQPEGADFWHEVSKGNLDVFYEKYPKKEECPKERLLKLNQDCNWTTFYSGNFMDEFLGFPNLNDIEVKEPEIVSDSIVNKVIESFKERSNVGIKKYGVTLDRKDLSPLEWINHFQQELQDGILYAEKLKEYFKDEERNK